MSKGGPSVEQHTGNKATEKPPEVRPPANQTAGDLCREAQDIARSNSANKVSPPAGSQGEDAELSKHGFPNCGIEPEKPGSVSHSAQSADLRRTNLARNGSIDSGSPVASASPGADAGAAGAADSGTKLRRTNLAHNGSIDSGSPVASASAVKDDGAAGAAGAADSGTKLRRTNLARNGSIDSGSPVASASPGADATKSPADSKAQRNLSQQQIQDATVRQGEGPYQSAARLLGKGANHDETMALAKAMKAQYQAETNGQDPSLTGLRVGKNLLNNENLAQTVDRISDKDMREQVIHDLAKPNGMKPEPEDDFKPKQDSKELPAGHGGKPGSPRNDRIPPKDEHPEKKPARKHPDEHPEKDDRSHGPVQHTNASYYGKGFFGNRTACGDIYTGKGMTAAHPTLPCGSRVEVKNLENGRRGIVTITDRGPYAPGRGIDLSQHAAGALGTKHDGVVPVEYRVLSYGKRRK
jgi:rare lipoprotein A (peptidoglycan hydrolase)